MKLFKKQNQIPKETEKKPSNQDQSSSDEYLYRPISLNVHENIEYIKKIQDKSWDLVTREMTLENRFQKLEVGLVFYAGLVDQRLLNKAVIDTVGDNFRNLTIELNDPNDRFRYIKDTMITVIGVDEADDYKKLFNTLLNGDMILFIEGANKCIIIGARMYQERSVGKPSIEINVKGSNDAFNENLLTNVSLIRKRIKNPHLLVKNYVIGRESNTNVAMVYIDGVADENVVKETKRRIEAIRPKNIIDSSYIVEEIDEKDFSMFPRIYTTERPDKVAANLFEGRVAILVDASPQAIIVPCVFIQLLHATEDFYMKSIIATFFRLLRFMALLISLFLPAFYISVIMHHAELMPVNLIFHVAGQRASVPFPAFLELIIMALAFDLLREAGTRMPNALGSTLSFVGAIIIGQSAVEAGLISQIIVIVIVVTGIGSLTIPNYDLNLAVTIMRYAITLLAILFGFYGMTLGIIALIIHVAKLQSFGVHYFSPFVPLSTSGMKDSIIRSPIRKLFKRKMKSTSQFPH